MKYYLIHGTDKSRKDRMLNEFNKAGINNDDVTWILYPNRDDITYELRNSCVMHIPSKTCGIDTLPGCPNLTLGQLEYL